MWEDIKSQQMRMKTLLSRDGGALLLTHHSRPVGASASTEQNTSIRACPSGLLARKSRPYADAPISKEIDIKKLSNVVKGMLIWYTRSEVMFLTCDDATEGQHELGLLTSLLWHTAIRVGGEIALQRARHQLKELTHLGLTGREKTTAWVLGHQAIRSWEGGQVHRYCYRKEATVTSIFFFVWVTYSAEDGVYAVFMSGDPPQQCAAGGPHGEAVLCLLGELLRKLIHLTLREYNNIAYHSTTS